MRKNEMICGTLMLRGNCCTDQVKIKPVYSGTWYLVPEEDTGKGRHVSLIRFDGRQVWEAYFYRFVDEEGWVLQRNGMYLRMPVKDFEGFFGKYEIKKNGN